MAHNDIRSPHSTLCWRSFSVSLLVDQLSCLLQFKAQLEKIDKSLRALPATAQVSELRSPSCNHVCHDVGLSISADVAICRLPVNKVSG